MAKKEKKQKEFQTEYTVTNSLKKGDIFTKLSAVVFGLGNIVRGQVIKGLLFLAMEIGLIYYFVSFGFHALSQLVTLGTKVTGQEWNEAKGIYEQVNGDNSMLILLYGVISIFIFAVLVITWRASLKSAYEAQCIKASGLKPNNFVQDVASMFDSKLNRTLLFLPVMGIVCFTIMPLVYMISMAFTNYDRNHIPPGKLFDWVGLKNFVKILNLNGSLGQTFWKVLGWTFVWAVFATFLNYILGMILAMVINRKETHWKGFWRFCFILSVAVPQFVSLLIMRTMLQPEGAVNILLRQIGLLGDGQSLPFWMNVTWARVTVIVINLWVGIPYTLLTMTGILQNIPVELYEAARVDGANAVVTFFKITLPYMLFVTTPNLITSFVGNINNFNVIYLLTGGNPASMSYYRGTAGKTDLLVTWLYKLTIDNKDYCYGAVIGILIFIISASLSLSVYHRTGSYNNEEGFQ